MKTNRLNCPRCHEHYPIGQLVCQIGRRMHCPSCGTPLAFSQRSAQRMGAIAGLTFGGILVFIGSDMIFAWPTFPLFMLLAFIYGRILPMLFGSLDIAPDKRSLDLFPNQSGIWKALSIGSLIAMILLGLSGFFWKYLPLWGIFTLSGLIVPVSIILVITTVQNLVGRNGVLRKEEKSEHVA